MKAPSNEIYDKSTQETYGLQHMGYNSVVIFIRLAVIASQSAKKNPTKFYENSNL